MSDNSNLAIGAGVGAIAGGTAGYAVGSKKAAEALKHYAPVKGLTIGSDEFIKAQSEYVEGSKKAAKVVETAKQAYLNDRFEANFDNIVTSYKGHKSKIMQAFNKVTQTAKKNFENGIAKKLVKNTKLKWAAGLAVAGAAIGAGIAAVANKVKADKAEQ